MAINPENITTIRVDQLANLGLTLDSLFPHTNGTELVSSPISDLVTLVASTIETGTGVGYLPISVTDGQQLPDIPENPSFFLCGVGTFLNVNGFPDIICTESLNAIMSVDDHWEIAVEIPIAPLSGAVQSVTGSAVDNTDPLNPVVNLSGATPNLQQVTDEGNETTNNVKFVIDVDNYIEVDTENRSIKIFKDGEQVANYYDNQVSLFDSALLQSLDLAPNLVNGASDDTSYRLENGTLTLVTPDGSIVITPEKITVNGIDYPLPTGASSQIATLADITGGSGGYTVVSSNLTAVNDTNYTVVANATFTDPSPTEGKGYVVYVRNGTATIGGTGYAVGSLVFRVFHSGAWSTREYKSNLTASDIPSGIDAVKIADGSVSNTEFQYINSLTSNAQTQLDNRDVLPVIYEKHANVPIFGSNSLNNLEGVSFAVQGGTARSFADTSLYTRRQRLGLTVATTGNLAQARQTITYFNRNSSLEIIVGLGFAENCTNANVRAFVGISTTINFTNVEPTALLNCIGLAKLTTSNNLHLIHNDGSGTATAIDLGASFPSNTIETDFYVLRLKTNGSNVDYTVTRVNTGGVASGTLTTDLPSASTALNLGYYVVQSTGANTTTGIDYFGTNLIKS
jgi:hypothetical protein